MKEKWKRIKGFPYYKVSNFGNVKSLLRLRKGTNNATRKYSGRILKPGKNTYGYPYVIFVRKNKFKKTFYIHILVLEYFGPPKPSPKHQCNHKDGNKENNHIDNLEWVTQSENIRHAFKNGLISIKSGENHHGSKLTKKKVKWIRSLYKTGKYTQKELGKLFDITQTHIGRITRNERWINEENSKKPFGGRFENQPEEDDIPF